MTQDHQLFEQVQLVLAGHGLDEALQALADSLVGAIGQAARDRAHAERMIDSLPPDLKRTLDRNWAYLRATRGGPSGAS